MSTLISTHRHRDANEVALQMMRCLTFEELCEALNDLTRERIRECDRMLERTNRILGRDFRERWAA